MIRSTLTKSKGLLNQAQFAKQKGWSRQYVGRLVRDGVITLEPSGLIDPKRADAQLSSNRGGTMRVAPIKSRRPDSASTSREERIQYAIDALLVSAATSLLNLQLGDPDRAESTLKMVLADLPAMLEGTFEG